MSETQSHQLNQEVSKVSEKGPGQPKKEITDNDRKDILKLSMLGLEIGEIARYIGMVRSTFYLRMEEDETIRDLIETGRARGKAGLLDEAYHRATKRDRDGLLVYLLKSVHGVVEKQVVHHHMGGQLSDLTIEELREKRKEIEGRIACMNNTRALLPPGTVVIEVETQEIRKTESSTT